jgi:hypothetical protein
MLDFRRVGLVRVALGQRDAAVGLEALTLPKGM